VYIKGSQTAERVLHCSVWMVM